MKKNIKTPSPDVVKRQMLEEAVFLIKTTKPDAKDVFWSDGERITTEVYGTKRYSGGIVVVTGAIKKQPRSVDVYYKDTFFPLILNNSISNHPMRDVIERLTTKLNKEAV